MPRLCCSRLVKKFPQDSQFATASASSAAQTSDDPLWNRSKQEPVCALRDFAPVVVAVEHLLQPVAKDRTQLLTSRVRHVHQRGRPQSLASPRKILRKNRARSPSLTTLRQCHVRDPVDGCPNMMPTTQVLRERLPWLQQRFPSKSETSCASPLCPPKEAAVTTSPSRVSRAGVVTRHRAHCKSICLRTSPHPPQTPRPSPRKKCAWSAVSATP